MSTFQIHIRENSFLRSDKQELLFLMLTLCYFMPFIFVKSLLVAFFFLIHVLISSSREKMDVTVDLRWLNRSSNSSRFPFNVRRIGVVMFY